MSALEAQRRWLKDLPEQGGALLERLEGEDRIGIVVSNFKCGHDAPASQLIQAILEAAGKPYFAFRDLDDTNQQPPCGS